MKTLKVAVCGLMVWLATATPVMAYNVKNKDKDGTIVETGGPEQAAFAGAAVAAGVGMGLSIIGAGIGLGRIGSAAMDGMARQPEVAPRINTAMIIIAAMLEGATLASVVLCFVTGLKATW